ncbi:nucleolar RNA-associated protein, putative [Entamoeba invadens IP1]|uniref:Nucleolar RNA-associated protein, putative n=1 Tax=Entamoeba invadens IP1 TaxID=370355 RepID=A0A0A1TZ00_ENTIV|nr:nucleolar RNA-associated protein, putative [Entamoeba invadens IP1]ELP83756.1 nucleolar RNA-associated protein, putative [Entamoeba invadens IP1]|eukprot:XP_004183102.1 nucleolar RNA-associated protein, putative [Entamoeba invadens IP1]
MEHVKTEVKSEEMSDEENSLSEYDKSQDDPQDESQDESDDEITDFTQYDLAIRIREGSRLSLETLNSMSEMISEALVGRIKKMDIVTDLSGFPSLKEKTKDILLLFKYDRWGCFKEQILGPSFEDKEKHEKFKHIWGELAEFRRFRDGRMMCVVTHQTESDKSFSTNEYFIRQLLIKHFGLTHHNMITDFNNIIRMLPPSTRGVDIRESTLELIDIIKNTKLPVDISTVRPISASTRFTSYIYPKKITNNTVDYSLYVESIPLVITFTYLGNWPDRLEAINSMKTSLSLEIKNQLSKQGIQGIVRTDGYTIYYKNYVFSIYYNSAEEMQLFFKYDDIENAKKCAHMYRQQPAVSSYLLESCLKNPSFSLSSRLVKKWIYSKGFSPYFNDEIVDAILSHFFFLKPIATPQKFFMKFINFFASVTTLPLEMGNKDEFIVKRDNGKGIIFNFDTDLAVNAYLNNFSPSLRVVRLLCGYAQQTQKLLQNNFCLKQNEVFAKELFAMPQFKNGITIKLDKKLFTKQNTKFLSDYCSQHASKIGFVDFDPLKKYTEEVVKFIKDDGLVFVNYIEGSDIYLQLNPKSQLGSLLAQKDMTCNITSFLTKTNLMTMGEFKLALQRLGGSFVTDVIIE